MPHPPICTPRCAAGCAKIKKPNPLNQYRKNKDGKYWFELIPEKDKERGMIHDSIMVFFNIMINTGQISNEINIEYKEYIAAVNKFLK